MNSLTPNNFTRKDSHGEVLKTQQRRPAELLVTDITVNRSGLQ